MAVGASAFGWEPWCVPRAGLSLALVGLGGRGPTPGVLGWRVQAGEEGWSGQARWT